MMEHIREILVTFILEYVPEQFVKMKLFDWFFLLILYIATLYQESHNPHRVTVNLPLLIFQF